MSAFVSLEAELRAVYAQCYLNAVNSSAENIPWAEHLCASIFEATQDLRHEISKAESQYSLPDSPQVLDELWREMISVRKHIDSLYSHFDQWYKLALQRIARPDSVSSDHLEDGFRELAKLAQTRAPLNTLTRLFCPTLNAREEHRIYGQIFDRCPVLRSFAERIVRLIEARDGLRSAELSNGPLNLRDFAILLQASSSSPLKLIADAFRDQSSPPPTPAPSETPCGCPSQEPVTLATVFQSPKPELGSAAAMTLLYGPIREVLEPLAARFENRNFIDVAKKIERVFARQPDPLPMLLDQSEMRVNQDSGPAPAVLSNCLVVLGTCDQEPIVRGVRKTRLTVAQYDVVEALLAAGIGGLSKVALAIESNHGDAHRILKRLRDTDPDWSAVILMAGKPGGRYRIRQNLPTSPETSRRAPTQRKKERA